jgi:hypothetical protein
MTAQSTIDKLVPRYPISIHLKLETLASWTEAQVEIIIDSLPAPKRLRGDLAYTAMMDGKLRLEFLWLAEYTGQKPDGDEVTGWKRYPLVCYALALDTQFSGEAQGIYKLTTPTAKIKIELADYHREQNPCSFRLKESDLPQE